MTGPIVRSFLFALDSFIMWKTLPRWWRRFMVLTFPISTPLAGLVALALLLPACFEAIILAFIHTLKEAWK
jgi:hypothetical protein